MVPSKYLSLEFYDQYIDGKYENISDYIENEPFVDVLIDAAEQVYNTMTYENDDPLVDAKAKDRENLDKAEEEIKDFPCDIEELDNISIGGLLSVKSFIILRSIPHELFDVFYFS